MAFVKLDTGILRSTLWIDREAREVFLTALLMAEPTEFSEPIKQIQVDAIKHTGFEAPPGWYGFVEAAGAGIIRFSMVDHALGMDALRRLGDPDPESRSKAHGGRRLIRVDGGYVVLNFIEYREKDHTSAERSRRWRERKKASASDTADTRVSNVATRDERKYVSKERNVTQAEAEAEAEAKAESRLSPSDSVAQERDDAINRVFVHWRSTWNHPKAKLDAKRRKLIVDRLKTYSEADLCQSITGYVNSPHHTGDNQRATMYDAIELFLRDAQHIDAGLKFYDQPPRTDQSALTRRNISATENWVPPELRHATA